MSWAIYDVALIPSRDAWVVFAENGDLRCNLEFSTRELHDLLPARPDRMSSAMHALAGGRGTLEADWEAGALAILEQVVFRGLWIHIPELTKDELGGLDLLRKMLV